MAAISCCCSRPAPAAPAPTSRGRRRSAPLEPPMLCMLLRKHISGGRVRDVRQINGDRILEIEFEHLDELGDSARKTLVCEFMGRHSNLILVDGEGRILECARRVTESMSSVREVLPGLRYERPPEHGKTPFDAPGEAIVRALQGASGPLHKGHRWRHQRPFRADGARTGLPRRGQRGRAHAGIGHGGRRPRRGPRPRRSAKRDRPGCCSLPKLASRWTWWPFRI